MKANWVANGLGGQSMYLFYLACQRRIPATLSITGDTGGENDRVCSNGKRMTARQFFDDYVRPMGEKHGIETLFVRSLDENSKPIITIDEMLERSAEIAKATNANFDAMIRGLCVPVFTNDKSRGRLRQSCTEKKKIRAIHQEARRRGVKTLVSAIGFHSGESHRIKARYLWDEGGFSIYKPQIKKKAKPPLTGHILKDIKWLEHYYPCVDLRLDRNAIRLELHKHNIPYLVTTECDRCPHQDLARWKMHTPESIERTAAIESCWKGKLFFNALRIPIKDAIKEMERLELLKDKREDVADFGCEDGAYCGLWVLGYFHCE